MLFRHVLALVCVLLLGHSAGSYAQAQPALEELRAYSGELFRPDMNEEVAHSLFISRYRDLFEPYYVPDLPGDLSTADLDALFSASALVLFYISDPRVLDHQQLLMERLEERGVARPEHYAALQQSLISSRDFDAARALAIEHPDLALQTVPITRPLPTPDAPFAFWAYDSAGEVLFERTSVPGNPQARLVVAFHPGCAFSRAAIAAFSQDNQLLAAGLFDQTLWLVPPDGELLTANEMDSIYPPENFRWGFAHSGSSWPSIALNEVPVFYFFSAGGELLHSKTGWLKDENQQAAQLELIRGWFSARN